MIDSAVRLREEERLMSALLAIPEARIFCGLLIEESGFLQNALRNSPECTAFAEGERNVGQRVFELAWRHREDDPLSCMREYGDWCRLLSDISDRERMASEKMGEIF